MANSIVSKFRGVAVVVTMVMVRMSILDGINGQKKLLGCQRVLTENSLYYSLSLGDLWVLVPYFLLCAAFSRERIPVT
jgi:hypothetical protein